MTEHTSTPLTVTKLGHSCVRIDAPGGRIVIDPGAFSSPDALEGAAAVLVTHHHPDHLAAGPLQAALASNPGLTVWATADAAELLGGAGERVAVAQPGARLSVAGLDVEVVGEWHAVIHPDIPRIGNVGYLVDGALLHPGDAFTVPEAAVDTLLLPVSAPWAKLSEVIDYVRAVGPRQALGIHDAIYSQAGLGIVARALGPEGVGIGPTTYVPWADGDVVTVGRP